MPETRPCVVLAVGARDRSTGPSWGGYTVDEAALRHGAGVEQETTDPRQAYAPVPKRETTAYREGWLPEDRAHDARPHHPQSCSHVFHGSGTATREASPRGTRLARGPAAGP